MLEDSPSIPQGVVLYTGVGRELTQYDIDVENAALVKRDTVHLHASAQYGWQHASRRYFYVATSDSGAGAVVGAPGNTHHVCAFRVDLVTGALQEHGPAIPLRQRPIHITTDIPSEHVLIAYNNPSSLSIHRIQADGTIGEEVKQRQPLDCGIWAHQIRVAPSNRVAILVTRGIDAAAGKAEQPGALKVFKYRDGLLGEVVSVAPGGGYGFGPRHLDFHPTRAWVYVSLERQHRVQLFTLNGETLSPQSLFSKDTLAEPDNLRPRQLAGTVHVHPSGHFVYGCERRTVDIHGQSIHRFDGGENTIVAYAIDQHSGEPNFIQRVETHGFHPRTFSIDPSGRLLIVANKSPVMAKQNNSERFVPASLDLFRIDPNGRLDYVRKYDVDVGNSAMFWSGLAKL